jgi:hypothetical protein
LGAIGSEIKTIVILGSYLDVTKTGLATEIDGQFWPHVILDLCRQFLLAIGLGICSSILQNLSKRSKTLSQGGV